MSKIRKVNATEVFRRPRVSEKSTILGESQNQIVMEVAKQATKQDIKSAAEKLFEVKVDNVRVLNVKGKKKSFRQKLGRRKDWKKAYISLAEGQDLNFLDKE